VLHSGLACDSIGIDDLYHLSPKQSRAPIFSIVPDWGKGKKGCKEGMRAGNGKNHRQLQLED
jgi:hypothetical protein